MDMEVVAKKMNNWYHLKCVGALLDSPQQRCLWKPAGNLTPSLKPPFSTQIESHSISAFILAAQSFSSRLHLTSQQSAE